jgi:hypothetical protein
MYSTTRPLMLIGTLEIGGRFLFVREVLACGSGGECVCSYAGAGQGGVLCGGASRCPRMGCWS